MMDYIVRYDSQQRVRAFNLSRSEANLSALASVYPWASVEGYQMLLEQIVTQGFIDTRRTTVFTDERAMLENSGFQVPENWCGF